MVFAGDFTTEIGSDANMCCHALHAGTGMVLCVLTTGMSSCRRGTQHVNYDVRATSPDSATGWLCHLRATGPYSADSHAHSTRAGQLYYELSIWSCSVYFWFPMTNQASLVPHVPLASDKNLLASVRVSVSVTVRQSNLGRTGIISGHLCH